MGGAAAGVDVAAVGLVGEDVDLGAEAAEDLRRGPVGGAVGAVEQDPPGAEVEVEEAAVKLAQVVLERAVQGPDPADHLGRGERLLELGLDFVLGVVVEFEAVGGEDLDAVVLIGIVRGGDDGGEVEAVAADEQRRGRGREHPAEQRVAACGGDAGRHRGLEHLPGLARVTDDQDLRAGRGLVGDRGTRQPQRELRGEELTRAATDTVGAEELTRHDDRDEGG